MPREHQLIGSKWGTNCLIHEERTRCLYRRCHRLIDLISRGRAAQVSSELMSWNSVEPGPDRNAQSSRATWSSIPPDGPGQSRTRPSVHLSGAIGIERLWPRSPIGRNGFNWSASGPGLAVVRWPKARRPQSWLRYCEEASTPTGEIMCIVGQYIPTEGMYDGWCC